VRCSLDHIDAALAAARARAAELGEVIRCLPTGEVLGDEMEVDVLLATSAPAAAVCNALERVTVDVLTPELSAGPPEVPGERIDVLSRPRGARVVGVRVDRIVSRRDVVIKPLGRGLRDL
jgi:hypothetical protein